MTIVDPGISRAFSLLDELEDLHRQMQPKLAELSDLLGTAVAKEGGDDTPTVAALPADELDLALTDMGRLLRERMVTADSMNPGGWMRLPGERRWRQIADVAKCRSTSPCRVVSFRDGRCKPLHVSPYDTFPYLSADEFDADCERAAA